MYLVYKTNAWHNYDSRVVIGLATSKESAIEICTEYAENEFQTITEEQVFNLSNSSQTQGYSGTGEFQYEEMFTDILLH